MNAAAMEEAHSGVASEEPAQPKPPQADQPSVSILSKKKKSGRRRHSGKYSVIEIEPGAGPAPDPGSMASTAAPNAANVSASVPITVEAGGVSTNVPKHTARQTITGEDKPAQSQLSLVQPPLEQPAATQETSQQPSLQQPLQSESTLQQPIFPQPSLPQDAVPQPTLPQPLALETGGTLPQTTGAAQQMPDGQALLLLPPASSAPAVTPGPFPFAQEPVLSAPVHMAMYQQQPMLNTAFRQAQPAPGFDYAFVAPGSAATIDPAAALSVVTGVQPVPYMSSLYGSPAGLQLMNTMGPHIATVPPMSQDYTSIPTDRHNGPSGASRAEPSTKHNASKASVGKRGLAYLKSIFRSEGETDSARKAAPVSGRDLVKSPPSEYGEEAVDELDEDSIASPVSQRSRSRSRAKSKSRASKSRKSVMVAQDKDLADAAASVGALRLDKDIVNKIVAALAARKQLAPQVAAPPPVQERKDGAVAPACVHKAAPCKVGHPVKKGAEELADSEDFFEEMVQEIVEPEQGAEDGPRKRIVRKTTKSRQHNVIEEPWEDKRRDNDLVTALDRMQAIKSRLSKVKKGDRDRMPYCEDDSLETTEIDSFENAGRTPSKFDWPCSSDEDNLAMPANVKKGVQPVKGDQRYGELPFRRPLPPPWHHVPLPTGNYPYNIGMMRTPHLPPMPMHFGRCAITPSLSPHTACNYGVCRCLCEPALYLHPSVPEQGRGCTQWPPCQQSLVGDACNGPNESRKNSECGNLMSHVGPCYETSPGCPVTNGHANQVYSRMGCSGQSYVPDVCPCCNHTTAHHCCHCEETFPSVAGPVHACSCLRNDACGANAGVATVSNLAGKCDAAASGVPQRVHHETTAKREGRPRRVVYRPCPPPPGLPVIEHPTQARLNGCPASGCAARSDEASALRSKCQGGGANHVSKRGLTLEEVLRREDDIRWEARLQYRRELLDEERLRQEERLAFTEYLKQQEELLENERQYLEKPEARKLMADLQRELARQKNFDKRQEKTLVETSGRGRAADVTQLSRQPRVGAEVPTDGPDVRGPSSLVRGVFDKPEATGARRKSVPGPQTLNGQRRSSLGPSAGSAATRTPETNGGKRAPSAAAAAARKPSISKP
ncbi:uncharacterized protein LOC144130438 [Amblyomma americanum]